MRDWLHPYIIGRLITKLNTAMDDTSVNVLKVEKSHNVMSGRKCLRKQT